MESGDDVVATVGLLQQGVVELLRARRLELGLSQADVANIVKLPTRRIEAMECERWNELPDGPYLRGFLRNVAKALNLDPLELVARVDGAHAGAPASVLAAPGATNIALPRRSGPAEDRRGGRKLVFGAFAFALVAALIAWSGTTSFERAVSGARSLVGAKRDDVAVAPSSDAAARTPPEAAMSMQPAPVPPAPVSTPSSPQDVAALPSTTLPLPSASDQTLRFHFNSDSWVEVRSSDGKVLLQGLNAAGSEQSVTGDPPFTLVVGKAKGVELRFRGQPVDLTTHIRDSVARLTLS